MTTWILRDKATETYLVTCPIWQNINGGDPVCTGYGDDLIAPPTESQWNLYEVVRNHTHKGWHWEPVTK